MGTKNKPGDFDCYANAEPDEPMFILLGRDPMAAELVRIWASMRESVGEDAAKVKEARDAADAMDEWAIHIGKSPRRVLLHVEHTVTVFPEDVRTEARAVRR